jgi:hypothetical protein
MKPALDVCFEKLGENKGEALMIPGSIVLLLILYSFLLQIDGHAVQRCECPGVLYQSMLDSHSQHNWLRDTIQAVNSSEPFAFAP